MTIRIHCDGCGGEAVRPEDFRCRGLVKIRHYCPECDKAVAVYEAALDEAHTAAARLWQEQRDQLRALHGGKVGALPDV